MRAWLLMLSGLLVWAVHFSGVYAIASVFDVISNANAPASRWTAAGFTALCLLADLAILALVRRRWRTVPDDAVDRWVLSVAGLGAGMSALSVFWQGLPALIGH